MKLNELGKQIHQNAKDKGFWDGERETGTLLMLCVSELSEAMEADRRGHYCNGNFKRVEEATADEIFKNRFERDVKDTYEDELADTIIRILDLCGAKGIDIEKHIEFKMKYNATRERMHGKKY